MRENNTGEQLSISRRSGSGLSIAGIGTLGGQISQLSLNGKNLIPEFAGTDQAALVYGYTLAPWPNRLADGKYEFNQHSYQAAKLDEQNNANHGLLLTEEMEIQSKHEGSLELSYSFGQDQQYPFAVDLVVKYELTEDSLLVTATATNNSGQPAPFAIGFHPYFLVDDDFELNASFTGKIFTDSRMLPTGKESVSGLSLRPDSPELASLDDCFFGAEAVTIKRPDFQYEIRALEGIEYFMFYRPAVKVFEAGQALAIEPMSHPANIFATDIGSTEIEAGGSRQYSFEIKIL